MTLRTRRLIPSVLASLTVLLPACGDSEAMSPAPVPQPDAAEDGAPDAGADVLPDSTEDASQDAIDELVDSGNDAPDATAPGPLCSPDGWCWSNPAPQGNSLWSLMGTSESDVWAVGESGTILHWNGTTWAGSLSGTTSWLTGLWSISPSEAFASGENDTLLRWDGTAWAPLGCQLSSPAWFDDVWASAPDDLWLTAGSRIVRRSGGACEESWTGTSLETLVEIWGSGPDDVWAAGWEWDDTQGRDFGITLRWDGSVWTKTRHDTSDRLQAIHGTGPDDVWAIGAGTDPIHWDGSAWTQHAVPAVSTYEGLWGIAPNDYWAVGTGGVVVHWDGATWTQSDVGTDRAIMGAWAVSGGAVFAGGEAGLLLHSSDGATFGRQDVAMPPASPPFAAAWPDESGRVWVAGGLGTVVRSHAGTWESLDTGCGSIVHGIAGSSASDVWIAGEEGAVFHYDGVAWTQVTTGSDAPLMGIWVPSAGEAWAVGGYSAVLHGTEAGLDPIDIGVQQNFTAVWGMGPDDLWIAGTNDTLLHWDGSAWEQAAIDPLNGPVSVVRALFGTSSTDIWAATTEGMLRWDGTVWHRVPATGLTEATSLWGSSGSDLHGVGLGGWAGHWDGTSWQRVSTGTTNDLFGLTGVGETAYAVGDKGTILVRE